MSVKTFGALVAAAFGLLLLYGVYRLTHLWEYEHIGQYAVRRNTLTGIVQIEAGGGGGQYVTSFENDQYADPIQPDELKRVKIVDLAWDRVGVLGAKALVAPGKPIKGRMALQITVLDVKMHKRIRDRDMRITVDWPGGALTPFVLRTNLTPPANANEQTTVTPQPTLYSGENTPATGSEP